MEIGKNVKVLQRYEDYVVYEIDGTCYSLDLLDQVTGHTRPEASAKFNYELDEPRFVLYGEYSFPIGSKLIVRGDGGRGNLMVISARDCSLTTVA